MLKGHSAGIGDLLRGSAAWRALRDRFPAAQLHLWFLTREPGYASEQLISQHHLLASFHASDKRTRGIRGWPQLWREAKQVTDRARPDLIVDFEPNGCRTSLLARWMGWRARARTVGIAQVPFRGWFYHQPAPSSLAYARSHGLAMPLEYAERDFVVLAALGIERNGTPIELRESETGRAFRQRLRAEFGGDGAPPLLGLNIGCGTPDAGAKRPDLDLLVGLVKALQRRYGFGVVLTGAPFEQDINREFLSRLGAGGHVADLAGRTTLLELTGAIAACRLFVSSDSGPYHMAVGLRVPTLAIFRWPSAEHYHHHEWIESRVAGGTEALPALLEAVEQLMRVRPPSPP
jgi:ADP-heptose:LPS heptosyltransferase